MTHEKVINFDDREEKCNFLRKVGALTGKWLFTAKRHKPKRSNRANKWYWSQIVPALQEYMQNHGQYFETEEVHEFLLGTHSVKTVIDPTTGEILRVIAKRSRNMDSGEFSTYANHCIEWLWDKFAIAIPEPDADWRKKRAA